MKICYNTPMEDKIFLFTIKDKDGTIAKYATAQYTQLEAEQTWEEEMACLHDTLNYSIKEIRDTDVEFEEDVIWF